MGEQAAAGTLPIATDEESVLYILHLENCISKIEKDI